MLLRRVGNKSEGGQSYESLCWQVATAGGKGRMTTTPLFDDVTSAHKNTYASIHPSLHHALPPSLCTRTDERTSNSRLCKQGYFLPLSVWEIELRALRVRVCGRRRLEGVYQMSKRGVRACPQLFFSIFLFSSSSELFGNRGVVTCDFFVFPWGEKNAWEGRSPKKKKKPKEEKWTFLFFSLFTVGSESNSFFPSCRNPPN